MLPGKGLKSLLALLSVHLLHGPRRHALLLRNCIHCCWVLNCMQALSLELERFHNMLLGFCL